LFVFGKYHFLMSEVCKLLSKRYNTIAGPRQYFGTMAIKPKSIVKSHFIMIVISHQKGWKVINQRSHGLLSAMLAYQYHIDLPNEVIVPTLIAIAEHDDGVRETAIQNNLTEAGAPRNFMISDGLKKTNLTQLLNVIEISSSKSQLNMLLTSLHLEFLYGGRKNPKDKELHNFLKKQEKLRSIALKNLNIDEQYADCLYRLLEWCDAFSLLICMNKIQPKGRKMEVSKSPDGDMNQTFYKTNNDITVVPWVFKNDTFKVFYEYKILEQLKFTSIKEFEELCKNTPIRKQEFIFSK
jgi:hypothetical protein